MVVVEQQHEQPDIGTRGLALLVEVAPDRRGRPRGVLLDRIDLDDGELFDLLGLVVLGDGELLGLEIEDRLPLPSVTMASTRTKLMPVLMGGCWARTGV